MDGPSPQAWFRDLGYDMELSLDESGVWWAALISLADPVFRIERYGRGETEQKAADRARRRWQVEQIGSPADRDRDHMQ